MLARLALVAVLSASLAGCGHAQYAKLTSWGQNHTVTFYPPGSPPEVFHTRGVVENEGESDGYYFQDAKTGRLVRLSGAVKIEIAD